MNKKKIIIIASAIVLVAIAGIAGYRLWPDQNRQINAAPLNTAVASKGISWWVSRVQVQYRRSTARASVPKKPGRSIRSWLRKAMLLKKVLC